MARTLIGRSQSWRGHLHVASFLVVVALLITSCSSVPTPSTPPASPGTSANLGPGSGAGSLALKQIDQAALQTMMDKTPKELLIPGAVILLRTPQGEFTVTYGTTLLGAISPLRAETYFRAASNTKTMTAALIMRLAQERRRGTTQPSRPS